jgi:spermidine/putrescine-binding protein
MNMSRRALAGVLALAATFGTAIAQDKKPVWLDEKLLPAAKAEGQVVVYSTTNEQEGLPLWKIFEDATGIKVLYVRASDAQILSRVIIEARAGQRTWDISQTANVQKFPQEVIGFLDQVFLFLE